MLRRPCWLGVLGASLAVSAFEGCGLSEAGLLSETSAEGGAAADDATAQDSPYVLPDGLAQVDGVPPDAGLDSPFDGGLDAPFDSGFDTGGAEVGTDTGNDV